MIEPASARDARAIAAIEAAVSSSPWSWAAVGELLEREGAVVLVAREEREIVGHVLATAVAGEGEILDLAVLPEARRRGHGRALLVALEEAWRARGVVSAFLEVRTDNAPARALYAARGWTPAGVRRGYYADGTDALVLCRELGGVP